MLTKNVGECPKRICLAPLEEVVGKFLMLEMDESEISVVLSCGDQRFVLSFLQEGLEGQTVQGDLALCKPGAKIALLKTNEASRPLLVRVIHPP